jgi:hypothetical protein
MLVNNAGVEGRLSDNGIMAPADTTAEEIRTIQRS